MIELNSSVKHIFLYGAGLLSEKVISFIMLPIMTRFLLPAEYGTLEVLLTIANTLSIALSCGLTEAVFCFGGMAKTPLLRDKICINAVTLELIIGIVVCTPMLLFSSKLSLFFPGKTTSWQIIYLGFYLVLMNLSALQFDWLRLKNDVKIFVLINFFRSLIQGCFVFIVLFYGYGVTGIMFVSVVVNVVNLFYINFFKLKTTLQFNSGLQKKLFFYGLPLGFCGIAEAIIIGLPTWWLAYTVGTAEMAIFAVSMKFAMVTLLLVYPFSMWWLPERYKDISTEAGKKRCAQNTEIGVALGFLFALGVAIFGSVLIMWLTPQIYHRAIMFLPGLSFMFALKHAANMMNTGLFLRRTQNVMWINIIVTVLSVVAFYFVIPYSPIWGIIIVLNIAFVLRWVLYVYFGQRELFLSYRYARLGIFLMVITASMISVNWMTSVSDYIIKGGLLWVLVVMFAFSLKLIPSFLRINKLGWYL